MLSGNVGNYVQTNLLSLSNLTAPVATRHKALGNDLCSTVWILFNNVSSVSYHSIGTASCTIIAPASTSSYNTGKFQYNFECLSNLNVPRQNELNTQSRVLRNVERLVQHGRPWTRAAVKGVRWEVGPSMSGWIVRSEFAWIQQGRLFRRLLPEVRCLALGHNFHGLGNLCG